MRGINLSLMPSFALSTSSGTKVTGWDSSSTMLNLRIGKQNDVLNTVFVYTI